MRMGLSEFTKMLGRWFVGQTVKDLLMEDGVGDMPPLLLRLSEPRANSMLSLALFRRRIVYANSVGDHVPYISASLGSTPRTDHATDYAPDSEHFDR